MPCMIGSMPEFGIGTAAQIHLGVAMTNLGPDSDTCGVLYHAGGPADPAAADRGRVRVSARGPGARRRGRHGRRRALAPERPGGRERPDASRAARMTTTPRALRSARDGTAQVLTLDAAPHDLHRRRRRGARPHDRRGRGRRPRCCRGGAPPACSTRAGAIVHPGFIDAHLHINAQTCRGFFRATAARAAGRARTTPTGRPRSGRRTRRPRPRSAVVEMLRHGYTDVRGAGERLRAGCGRRRRRRRSGVRCYARRSLSLGRPVADGRDSGPQEPEPVRARPPTRERSLKLLGSQLHRQPRSRTASCTATSRSTARARRPTSCFARPRRSPIARASS